MVLLLESNRQLTLIFLPKYLGEVDLLRDGFWPGSGVKAEFWLLPFFRDGWELEEIASDDNLDPAKGSLIFSDGLADFAELVEQVTFDH